MQRTFEDIEIGESHDVGTFTLSKSDVIEFGERYDPLSIHVDERAAAASRYEGLIASAWQLGANAMREIVDGFLGETAVVAGRGVDDLRVYRPVRPNETIGVSIEIVDKTPETRPGMGLLEVKASLRDEDGSERMSMVVLPIVYRRSAID